MTDTLGNMNDVIRFPSPLDCEPEWLERPVSAIATHISAVYHEFTRERLPLLRASHRVWPGCTAAAGRSSCLP